MGYGAAIILGDLTSLELAEPSPAAAAVYDRPIGLRLLHEDPGGGEEHCNAASEVRGIAGRQHSIATGVENSVDRTSPQTRDRPALAHAR